MARGYSSSSYGNPTRLFKRAFAVIYVGEAVLRYLIDLFFAFAKFLTSIVSNMHWITFVGGLWFLSMVFFSYGFPIIEQAEYLWRCEIQPWYPEIFRPFFAALKEAWEDICWWNLIGQTQRLLTGKLIWEILMQCENGFRFWDFIVDVLKSFVYLFSTYFKWFYAGNPVDDQLPIYPWFRSIAVLGTDLGNMIVCLCNDLRIMIELFTRIVIANNLSCMLHQATNALLNVLQVIVRFAIDSIRLFFDMLVANPGDFDYVVAKLSGEIPGFTMPSMVSTTERIAVAAYYGGQFLNDALQITICTGISEIEAQGDVSLVETKYEECMLRNDTRTDLFCWLGPFVGGFYRLERVIFAVVINVPRILYELVDQPAGNRFLTDDLPVDVFYDTLRKRPPRYNYSDSLNAPTLIVGSNASRIVPLQPDMYGNYTDPADVSCYDYNVSRFVIPCQNCSEVEQYDLEECLCNTARDVDRLIEDILDFKVLDGVLCCVIGRIIRVMTAVTKFLQGLACHIIVFDRFSEFVTDQNNWNIPIDELIGPYYEVGGLLGCCARILVGFDARLECLCTLIVNVVKPMGEGIRILLESVVAGLNDVFDTGNIGFFDVVCTTKPTCFDLEDRVFKYLRRTRPNAINGTDPNYLDAYFPVDTTQPEAWIDCFCSLISFQFLNQFRDEPADELPDFCCALNVAFRFVVELIKFAVEFLFTSFETVASLFQPGPVQLTFLGYLACETVESCAPIAQMLSDIRDFLNCPCTLIQAIDNIIDPTKQDLLCLCDFFNAVASLFYDLLHGIAMGGRVVVELLDCIYLGFPPGQDCGFVPEGCVGTECDSVLFERVNQIFIDFKQALLDLADIIGTVGCVLGLLFRFDCVGTRYYSPQDYPICSHGSSYGVCSMSDRLQRFFRDTFLIIIAIPDFILNIFKGFAMVAFHVSFTGFSGISDLVYKFLIALGNPFFGIAEYVDPDTGVTVPATTGWVQSLCLLLNCLIGPPTDECTNEAGPALDSNAEGLCIGDPLCVLGNILRDLWQEIASLIASIIGIIEALLTGNGDLLADRIVQFFQSLIDILITVLGGLQNLIQTFINAVVGIANSILPGFGTLLGFALNIALGVAQLLLIIIGNLLVTGGNKRAHATAAEGNYAYHGFDATDDASFELGSSYWNLFWNSPSDIMKENRDKLVYHYAKHFKFAFFDKPIDANDKSYSYYDRDGKVSELLRERRKRDDGDGEDSKVTYDDLRSMDFKAKTETMREKMTGGTDCKKAMEQFSALDSFDQMSLSEVWIWKACFVAYALPIGVNAFYDPSSAPPSSSSSFTEETKKRDATYSSFTSSTGNPLSYLGIQLPDDVFYNAETFLNSVIDTAGILKEYASWRVQYKSILDELPQDYVDMSYVPDWFWEYEKEAYAASRSPDAPAPENDGKKREVRRSYTYEPRKSKSPNRYVHHPEEIWERVNEHLLFINLPGDQLSVPVIDGRYPLYKKNVTFSEHLAQKGYTSDFARALSQSLVFQDKATMEDSMLRFYSSVNEVEKTIREERKNSTDEYGNYYANETTKSAKYKYEWIRQNYPGSSLGGLMWEKLFQMNPAAKKTTSKTASAFSSSSQQTGKKRNENEPYDLSDYVSAFYEAATGVQNYWNDLIGKGPRKDYAKMTEGLFESFDDSNDGNAMSEKKYRSKVVADAYGKTFDDAIPKIKRNVRERVLPRASSFDFGGYFTKVVPQAIGYTWGRLTGSVNLDEVLFDIWVRREYDGKIDVNDLKTKTMLNPNANKRFFAASGEEERYDDDDDDDGSYLTYENVKKVYEGKYYSGNERNNERTGERRRYAVQGERSKKRSKTMEEEEFGEGKTIREMYGRILGNDSLVSHRLKMMRDAASFVTNRAFNTTFSLTRIGEKFRERRLDRYLKLYSDTIREKGKTPTFFPLFSLVERIFSAFNGEGKYEEGHVFHPDSKIKRFMTYGDEKYDDGPNAAVKRGYVPLLPLCLPGNAELTCISCKKCPVAECSACTSCRNCTAFVGGDVECERCAVCSVGGPDCTGGCTGCETCDTEASCLDCEIIEAFISSIYYYITYCIALANGDTSVIRQPVPNTTLVKIVYRNATNPTEYDDRIADFFFNTVLGAITDVDVGQTIVLFFEDTDLDPFEDGSVGLLFFLRRWLHLPHIRQCNWDIDLQCVFGHGLEEGIVFATIICVALGIICWFVFPPLAGVLSNFIVTMGWLIFWATLVMSRAWFYNPYCLLSPESIIYSFLFPNFPILPMFPSCAMDDILAFLDKWILPCYDFFQIMFFSKLTDNGETCLTCPMKQQLYDCHGFGFYSQATTLGYYAQRQWPNGATYLNQTCLVKGGCFMGLGGDWGPLQDFFNHTFNITYNVNGTPTNWTETLDTCAASYIWTDLATLALFLLLGLLLIPLIIDVLNATWLFLQRLLVIPPFSFLVCWPFKYIVNPYDPYGWSSPGSFAYNPTLNSDYDGVEDDFYSLYDNKDRYDPKKNEDREKKKRKKGKGKKEKRKNKGTSTASKSGKKRKPKSRYGIGGNVGESDGYLERWSSLSSSSSSSSSSEGGGRGFRGSLRKKETFGLSKWIKTAMVWITNMIEESRLHAYNNRRRKKYD